MNKIKDTKISIIGLGKLGACLAATLAYKRFDVMGYDINEKTVALISKGQAPVVEPQLQEIIDSSKGRLAATNDFDTLAEHSNITFIIVPTPSEKDGSFSITHLKKVLEELAKHVKDKKEHHSIVINSTVTPTTIDNELIPFFENKTGKKVNDGWSICYNPEFIALGNVVAGILEPDVVLIGESNVEAGDELEGIYKQLLNNKPSIARMSLVSAEIAKIALNAYVTMKISFANTLGNICEKVPGADADVISEALGSDKRIAPHFIKSGLAFGGPCFPRDNRAFDFFAKQIGVDAPLARATDQVNDFQTENLFKKISKTLEELDYDSISILGLSYKPKTDVIEESAIIKVIDRLLDEYPELEIHVYDPIALENTRGYFGDRISYQPSAKQCVAQSPFWIVASPEKEFETLSARDVHHNLTTIIDCWRLFNQTDFGNGVQYLPLGVNYYERN